MGPRSPVNAHRLRALLRGHPRRALVRHLWSGFMFGFALGYRGPVTAARPRNLLSARSRRSAVTVAVALEVSRGHTAGPFVRPPFRLFHCSPLGAAVKPDGSVRLVLDLSSPRGASVNSSISREEFAVRYTSVDAAVDIVRRLGKDAFMAKAGIRHAFRLCPVRPADWPLLCYKWAGRVYVDLRLPFGARSSPFIFTQFVETLHWIAVHVRGCLHVLHSLDDYFLARASQAACARDLDAFQDLCRDLGVPLAPEKLVVPTRCLQLLGITLDSLLQEMRLPPEKLARLRACLPAWRTRQKCTKRELLSLIGMLSFACKVVRPSRIFLRRLIDLSMTVPALAHHISLTAAARADIAWWVEFLPSWNGRAFFPPPPVAAAALGFATDASGVGLGAVFGQQWLYAAWPPPSARIISMSWSCLPWRSPSIAGAGSGVTHRFSCTRTICRWCRSGRRARVSALTSCRWCAGFSFSSPSGT